MRRVHRINQYFDGKCTDDEILYSADISRKDLREVLHHYEEYVSALAVAGREILTSEHKSYKHSYIRPSAFTTPCVPSQAAAPLSNSRKSSSFPLGRIPV